MPESPLCEMVADTQTALRANSRSRTAVEIS